MKLAKISTKLSAEQVQIINESLTPEQVQKAESLNVVCFDVVENGCVAMYVFYALDQDIQTILATFQDNSVEYSIEDWTEKALFGSANVDDHNFNCELKRWAEQNITIDVVLDKISKLGKNSLTDSDYRVLENF